MITVANKRDLLAYFGARSLPGLERQFNMDGRMLPVLLDVSPDGKELMLATGARMQYEVLNVLTFPVCVSDFLGQVELDRIAAETLAGI